MSEGNRYYVDVFVDEPWEVERSVTPGIWRLVSGGLVIYCNMETLVSLGEALHETATRMVAEEKS